MQRIAVQDVSQVAAADGSNFSLFRIVFYQMCSEFCSFSLFA